jgi:hypothetical protein
MGSGRKGRAFRVRDAEKLFRERERGREGEREREREREELFNGRIGSLTTNLSFELR